MLGVDLDGSRRIEPAHVACAVGSDGSRRIQKDRLDDQMDDQGAFDGKSDAAPRPLHVRRPGDRQLSSWNTALQNAAMLMTTLRPDPPPSKSSLVMPTTSPRAFSSGPPELSRLLLRQLPFELAPHSTAGLSPNSSSSNSWRISISPSASGSPPASNGSRLAHSMASSIDFTRRIQ
jgi:hypothetical protein